jgi:hypothetical protein
MELSSQLHAPAVSAPGKVPWYPLDRSLTLFIKVKVKGKVTRHEDVFGEWMYNSTPYSVHMQNKMSAVSETTFHRFKTSEKSMLL